jgi:hypothetical protein
MAKRYKARDILSSEMTVSEYAEAKLDMLRREMGIAVTSTEKGRLLTRETVIAVDNCARQIIEDHWG